MTRLLLAFLLLLSAPSLGGRSTPAPLPPKAWLLYDFSSAQAIISANQHERVEPASLTKLMTAYLAFSALKQKTLSLEQVVPVSERAWKAPGSRMFIEPRKPVQRGRTAARHDHAVGQRRLHRAGRSHRRLRRTCSRK